MEEQEADGEAAHMEFQQYGGLNETWIMTTSVAMPTWMGEVSQGLTPQRAQAIIGYLENKCSPVMSLLIQAQNMYIQAIVTGHGKFNRSIDGQKHGSIASHHGFEDLGGVEGRERKCSYNTQL